LRRGREIQRAIEDRPRALLIEDDAGVADTIARTLRARGLRAIVEEQGRAGLARAVAADFEVVILDLLLPDVDGITLLERLLAARPRQQVLVVSAVASVEAKVRCLELGAADYLAKPFALDELAARVHARLRAGGEAAADGVLRDSTITLDLQRRLVHHDGKIVPLSSREFALLEYLLRHAGRVCSRKELLEYIWGYDFDPRTNVVDVYVRRLRVKLKAVQIQTVRNAGYCLVPSEPPTSSFRSGPRLARA
jgi:two-component system OmpR family response regulator